MTSRRSAALLATPLLLLSVAAAARAQVTEPSVRVTDRGPGPSGRLIEEALAGPHVTRVADGARVDLPPDTTFASSVVVLGGDATVASVVRGDVIVVGGDLFLHPGAEITGRAVAIGGCVYNSTLATVRGERVCFRENTFALAEGASGEVTLAYRALRVTPPSRIYLAGIGGLLAPAYDRVNGASIAWGPTIALDTGRFEVGPRATYRSDLGVVDPSVGARAQLGRRTLALVSAARGTYTNETWIRGDVVNTVSAFATGADVRNYYRADRVDAQLSRVYDTPLGEITLLGGALSERAWAVGPDSITESAPFSIIGRRDRREGMLRPNPGGATGRITSGRVGVGTAYDGEELSGRTTLVVEVPFEGPTGRFVQTTFDAETTFPTFGTHTLTAGAHALLTTGASTPRQRWGYVAGAGTLPTEDLLEFGGDRLLYVDGLYTVPLDRLHLPLVGAPAVALRYAAGSAGVRALPRFVQNVGLRLIVSLARLDFTVNPASGETAIGVGVAVLR